MKQTFAWLGALLLVASLLALQPAGQVGPWVDLLRGWDSSAGQGNHYLQVRLPTSNPRRPLLATVTKTVGGCGSLATRQWILVVAQPAHDLPDGPARTSWVHWERGGVDPAQKFGRKSRVLAVREFGTLVDPPGVIGCEPKPRIFYRQHGGSYQVLTYSDPHPLEEWNPSPGWSTCLLGQPWRRSDRSGS